ncbi:cold shock small protein YmcF [Cedecea davisae]|uniref:cold shock small protein YmcF n=1 Tax=Cedecea davisae TaxID=158484 RepID=UPI0035580889
MFNNQKKESFILNLLFQCPSCGGSQYRTSSYDVRESNPHGAVCIFCKSAMQVSAHRPLNATFSGFSPLAQQALPSSQPRC